MKRLLLIMLKPASLLAISLTPPIPLATLSSNSSSPIEVKEKDKEKTPPPPSLTPQLRVIAKEYLSLAYICMQEEKYEKAIQYFQEVIKRTSDNTEALSKLGELTEQLHCYSRAIEYYKKVIELEPNNTNAYTNIGKCYFHTQKLFEAKTHLKITLGLNSEQCDAHFFLGMIAEKEKQYTQALSYYRTALSLSSNTIDIHYHLGTTYSHLSEWANAISQFEKALEQDPEHSATLIALANTCNLSGNPDKALLLYEKVLATDPHNTTARYNYGYTLKQQGKLPEAIAIYQQVIADQPDYALAHFSLGLTYLALGDFEQGLIEYEWRTRLYRDPLPEVTAVRWEGQTLTKKTILLIAEQGMGDTIQFIRYAQYLKNDGAHIIVMAQEPLIPLLSLCPYLDKVITIREAIPNTDYWLPLMSLPLVYKTTSKTIPAPVPYLRSHPHLTAYWKSYLAEDSNIKIGICWQANDQYNAQPLKYAVQIKSIPLNTLITISAVTGITLYSLQRQLGTEQIEELANPKTLHIFDESFDVIHGRFMDSAAVINNLDLIISADTAIAHLAAALGKKVWLLVPTPCDWRWQLEQTDSPWYPTIRIFRQKKAGDWDSTIAEITSQLEQLIKQKESR